MFALDALRWRHPYQCLLEQWKLNSNIFELFSAFRFPETLRGDFRGLLLQLLPLPLQLRS